MPVERDDRREGFTHETDSWRKLFTATRNAPLRGEGMSSRNTSGTRRLIVCIVWVAILGPSVLAVFSAPVASGLTWTQTTQTDFLRGSRANIEILSSGAIQLSSNTSWSKAGVVLDLGTPPSSDSSQTRAASVIKDGSTYRMWFSGGYWGGGPFGELWARIYSATSTDGASWGIQGVVLDLGAAGSWDDHGLEFPSVTRDASGTYYMYYLGWTAGS